jgi:hypothetical protein
MKKPIPQIKWDAIVNLGVRAVQAEEKVYDLLRALKRIARRRDL